MDDSYLEVPPEKEEKKEENYLEVDPISVSLSELPKNDKVGPETSGGSGSADQDHTEVTDAAYSEVPDMEHAGAADTSWSEVSLSPAADAPMIPLDPPKTYGPEDVGLVLAGGGGKGAYEIGVLKALAEEGILKNVKAVAGTSIGAVNAVLYAQGDFDKAYKAWDDIDMSVLFDLDPSKMMAGKALASRNEMNRLMDNYVDYDRISSGEMEIYCGVAEDLGGDRYNGEYMRLNHKSTGEIRNILMASTAMPVIYDAVSIGGKNYRDGGLVDNEPVKPLYDAGLRKFIVIVLDSEKVFTFPQYGDAEFLVISPSHDLGDVFSGTLNFYEKDKAIKRLLGYKDGKRAIKTKIEKDENYIALERAFAIRDYEECVKQVTHEATVSRLEQDINSRFDYISEIEKKYDI